MDQRLREAWHAREQSLPINPVLHLAEPSRSKNSAEWLDQSAAQLAAAGGRPIRWHFAEPETKTFANKLFRSAGGGRARIETQILPWPESAP